MVDYRNIVASASSYIRENALYAHRIDWNSVETHLSIESYSGASVTDAHLYIGEIVKQLGDFHSHIVTNEMQGARYSSCPSYPSASTHTTRHGVVGYIGVPGFVETSELPEARYIEAIRQGIAEVNESQLIGWIVDLRENGGGNMWPMLSALAGLLEGPPVGCFIDREKHKYYWSVADGCARLDNQIVSESAYLHDVKLQCHLPLACLTSSKTCSSGEAVVVALKGRKHSRQFGTPTCGLSTANEGYPLPCGSMLWLTTAVFADRSGIQYGSKIQPDVLLDDDIANLDMFERAAEWMNGLE